MNYLHYDIYSIRAGLKDVLHNSAAVARNTGSMASSLKKFQTVMDRGFIGVQSELSDIYNQLDDLLDIMIDFRNTQFIQNETRNQLLASIDRTLKAPNKTAAHEQYEISLELAQKNKHEMAIKFLKEAIALNPLHYRAYVQLTLNLLKMKSYKEALHYAAESVSFAPNNKEILAYSYSLAALASEKTKDYKGALQYINQSISLHIQPKYTYARARYYAFLNDINKSISELKRTIERDHSYFALSLVDSAFHPYHREREQLLTAMKMEIESKLDHAITQMESVQLFRYNYEKLSTAELQYNGYDDSIIDYRYNRLHPNFSGYKFISITGVNGKEMYYSYNSLLYHFDDYYYELIELHKNKRERKIVCVNRI